MLSVSGGGSALAEMLGAIPEAKAAEGKAERLAPVLERRRKPQGRLDVLAAENSRGFHGPWEAARVLAQAIDDARQAQDPGAPAHAQSAGHDEAGPSEGLA